MTYTIQVIMTRLGIRLYVLHEICYLQREYYKITEQFCEYNVMLFNFKDHELSWLNIVIKLKLYFDDY
jgi:hypothetical protein